MRRAATRDLWERAFHDVPDIASERHFYGLIEDLAKQTSRPKRPTCRGWGVHFEACWPISGSCPGVRTCAARARLSGRNAPQRTP